MQKWRGVLTLIVVVGLFFSLAACQKSAKQAEEAKAPEKTELSSASKVTSEAQTEAKTKMEEAKTEAAKEEKVEEKTMPAEESKKEPEAKKAAEPITRDNAEAIIEMANGGKIVIKFYPKDAPNTVDNFIKLAQKGFYDGLTFHRVVPGFVVQGGDPRGDGTGGPGYKIKAEFNSRKHLEGTVAMARSADPDSAGSQFYICLAPQPFLDGKYTVFGQVIKGMDVVHKIAKGDVMKKVTIVNKEAEKE